MIYYNYCEAFPGKLAEDGKSRERMNRSQAMMCHLKVPLWTDLATVFWRYCRWHLRGVTFGGQRGWGIYTPVLIMIRGSKFLSGIHTSPGTSFSIIAGQEQSSERHGCWLLGVKPHWELAPKGSSAIGGKCSGNCEVLYQVLIPSSHLSH